jgi:hypothetical protein
MENNKYFTPDIEDLCIGYELELLCVIEGSNEKEETWKNTIIYNLYVENKEEFIKSVRVPYLTKEQIEAEGWIYKTKSTDLWFERKEIFLREDGYHLQNIKLQYGLHDYRLKISFVYVGDNEEESVNAYLGKCKDINTFRKIIKLLGI